MLNNYASTLEAYLKVTWLFQCSIEPISFTVANYWYQIELYQPYHWFAALWSLSIRNNNTLGYYVVEAKLNAKPCTTISEVMTKMNKKELKLTCRWFGSKLKQIVEVEAVISMSNIFATFVPSWVQIN